MPCCQKPEKRGLNFLVGKLNEYRVIFLTVLGIFALPCLIYLGFYLERLKIRWYLQDVIVKQERDPAPPTQDYRIFFVPASEVEKNCDSEDLWGCCDEDSKTIWIDDSLTGKKRAEILLHELLHSSAFKVLSEEYVTDTAIILTEELSKQGLLKE